MRALNAGLFLVPHCSQPPSRIVLTRPRACFGTAGNKPDAKEFKKIAFATACGFLIMGFIGFFVKLVHIPINNIIVGA